MLPWLLFLLAFWARFHNLLLIEHNVDHAYYVGQALRTLDRGEWPIIGQATSLQVPNSAFLGYLYLPLLGLTRTVLSAYMLVIALNSVGAALIYRLGVATIGVTGAVIAGLLYAINPWMIEYTRSPWSYSVMPFLLCLLALALWRILTTEGRRQTRAVMIAMVSTTMITLVTLTGYFILPTLVVLCGVFRRWLPWRKLWVALPIFLIPTLVFAVALLIQWQQTSHQAEAFLGASQSSALRPEPLLHTLRLVTGADYELLRGSEAPIRDQALRHGLSWGLQIAILLLIVTGILRLGWLARFSTRQRTVLLLLLPTLLTPILLMSYNSALIHPFYLMVTLPAGYLLAGAGAQGWWQWNMARPVLMVGLACFSVMMLVNSERYDEETQAIPGAHELTALPLGAGLALGNVIMQQPERVVFTNVQEWIIQSFSGHAVTVNRTADNRTRMLVPPVGGLIVSMQPAEQPLVQTTVLKQFDLVDGSLIRVEQVTADTWQPASFQPYKCQQSGAVALLGYRVTPQADGWLLDVYWRVNQPPATLSDLYSLAVHVFENDQRILIADGKPIASDQWQAGAVLAQRARLLLNPALAYRIKVGLYDGASGHSVDVQTPDSADGMVWLPDTLTAAP